MTNVLSIFITAAPKSLLQTTGDPYVTMNTNLTLFVDVSADPLPNVTWQLNGGDLAAMTTTTIK